MRPVDRIEAHHSLAEDRGSSAAEMHRIVGLDLGSFVGGALEAGTERCYGSGRNCVGTGLQAEAERHSHAEEVVHRDHGKAVGKGSARWLVAERGCDRLRRCCGRILTWAGGYGLWCPWL